MKITLLTILLLPFFLMGQTYHERSLNISPSNPLNIIHLEANVHSDIMFEGSNRASEFDNIVSNQGNNYLLMRENKIDNIAKLNIYKFNNGDVGEKHQIIADKKGSTKTEFDIVYFDKDELVVQSKELIPGINDFVKKPPARMDHYKIQDGKAILLNDYESQPLYLIESDMDNYGGFKKVGDKYYFISANFFPDKKDPDKLYIGRKLTSLQF